MRGRGGRSGALGRRRSTARDHVRGCGGGLEGALAGGAGSSKIGAVDLDSVIVIASEARAMALRADIAR